MTFLVFVLAFGKQFNLSNLDRHVSFTLPLLVVLKLEHASETSEDMFGDRLLRPTSKVFDSVHLFAFPVDSQVILTLLVWGSHLESHCIKCYNSSRLSHSSSLFFFFLLSNLSIDDFMHIHNFDYQLHSNDTQIYMPKYPIGVKNLHLCASVTPKLSVLVISL